MPRKTDKAPTAKAEASTQDAPRTPTPAPARKAKAGVGSKTAQTKIKTKTPFPGPAYDPSVASKVRSMAAQGTAEDLAARFLGFSQEDMLRVYAKEWADGLAAGEINVDQAVFDQAVGRPAKFDDQGRMIRAEVKVNPAVAMYLRRRLDGVRNRARLRQAIDDPAAWAGVHPEQRPPGVQVPAPEKRGRGRPKFTGKFTRALGQEICDRLTSGEFLESICKSPDMPRPNQVLVWAADPETYPEFSIDFACAREAQIAALVRRATEVIENPGADQIVTTRIGPDGETVEVRRTRDVALAKAQAEIYLKAAAMLDGGRRRAQLNLALLERALGMDDDDLNEMDGATDVGPVEVVIRGGTPKG